jgi:alanine dehydrogenase
MPGAVPRTSTYALTNATLPYALRLANLGVREAARQDRGVALGVNTVEGALTEPGVAEAHGLEHTPLRDVWG